ncbi:hypothetical protein HMPREF1322_0289 [Porphyromonas gingivalis W50]|nr:hypothetical protein HMPREF1322_0289 [Porphyromonas gingivalis W50]
MELELSIHLFFFSYTQWTVGGGAFPLLCVGFSLSPPIP